VATPEQHRRGLEVTSLAIVLAVAAIVFMAGVCVGRLL
jgi:hypothetical protein